MGKIVFYIMTVKGLEALRHACDTSSESIRYVVVGRDVNVKNDFSNAITELAYQYGIPCFYRGEEPSVDPRDYILAISWRWMIEHPERKLIIFHDSLLPKYRGFAPLVNMLINGENQIGVSAIFGAKEYDRGDIIGQRSSAISYPITISEAIEINLQNFKVLIRDVVEKISHGVDLIGTAQSEADATYSIWRDEEDYRINWSNSAKEIKRFIDAVGFPYLGASCLVNGSQVRILQAEVVDDLYCELRHVGKVLFVDSGMPTVICGKGLLRITEAMVSGDEEISFLPMAKFRSRFV